MEIQDSLFDLIESKPGYGYRRNGRICHRGHHAPIRIVRNECSQCKAEIERVRAIVTRAIRYVAKGQAVPSILLDEIGCTHIGLAQFVSSSCEALGFPVSGYGEIWEVARHQQIASLDYHTPEGRKAANHLANLFVRARRNPPKARADDETPTLFNLNEY